MDRNGLRPFVIDFGVCSLLERKNRRLAHLPLRDAGASRGRQAARHGHVALHAARAGARRGRPPGRRLGARRPRSTTSSRARRPTSRPPGRTVSAARPGGRAAPADRAGPPRGQPVGGARVPAKLAPLEERGGRTLEDLQRDVLAARVLPRPSTVPRALDAIAAKAMARRPRAALPARAGAPRRPAGVARGPARAGSRRAPRAPCWGRSTGPALFLRRHRRGRALLLGGGRPRRLGRGQPAGPGGGAGRVRGPPGTSLERAAREARGARRSRTRPRPICPPARPQAEAARAAFREGRWTDGRAPTWRPSPALLGSGILDPVALPRHRRRPRGDRRARAPRGADDARW